MNPVDIVILVVVFLSTIVGLSRGFTRELLGLFTWAGAAIAAYLTIPMFSGFTRQFVTNPMMSDLLTGAALFIIYLIILSIFTSFVSNSVHNSILGGVDRALGFAFGFIRGVALILVAEVIFSLFIPRAHQGQAFQSSYFAPSIRRGGDTLFRSLPTNWQQYIISQIAKSTDKSKAAPEIGHQQPMTQFPGQGVPQQTPSYPPQTPGQPSYPGQPAPQQTPSYPPQTPGQPSSPVDQARQGVPQQHPSYPSQATPQVYPPVPGGQETHQQPTATPTNQTVEEDIEKTAESLANLKPQSVPIKNRDGQYDNRQRREMERLFQTTE